MGDTHTEDVVVRVSNYYVTTLTTTRVARSKLKDMVPRVSCVCRIARRGRDGKEEEEDGEVSVFASSLVYFTFLLSSSSSVTTRHHMDGRWEKPKGFQTAAAAVTLRGEMEGGGGDIIRHTHTRIEEGG